MPPEGAHPLPGWEGLPAADFDGRNWTIKFAASHLDIPEPLLREAVKYIQLPPSGTLNMREFRSQGRAARAYSASHLITISETLRALLDGMQS